MCSEADLGEGGVGGGGGDVNWLCLLAVDPDSQTFTFTKSEQYTDFQ